MDAKENSARCKHKKKIINITVCYMCSYKPTRLCYVVGVLGLIGGETT